MRSALRKYRRPIVAVLALGVVYSAAIETWLPRNDVIDGRIETVMVLGSGVRKNGLLEPNGARRLQQGIAVAKANRATLYTTRERRLKKPFLTSDSGQRVIADSAGFAGLKVLGGLVANTRDEAAGFRWVAQPGRIAVVTSRLHTRRACAAFEKLGYSVTCVSAGPESPLWMTPYFIAYESAAWVKYRLEGWI